jgi:hypothetical protein
MKKSPLNHCSSDMMHSEAWNSMRKRSYVGKKSALNMLGVSPLNIKEEAYEKQNKKMRSDHKKETGKDLGSRQTTGKGSRRVSFACRFGGMAGGMTDDNGEPSKLAMALKKWGFSSKGEATSFCNANKES